MKEYMTQIHVYFNMFTLFTISSKNEYNKSQNKYIFVKFSPNPIKTAEKKKIKYN